ncbi:hypothetical protein T01_2785 [Trichinella spiralis]|uniref:Uncharacterized protein n=1 Tax=Trichinella spiralis TaxID=6334 RepID=A0A0V0YT80_TRISP|nr:hypothetical protein T01_5012 [Trichinella spiralis]KRY05878.1 hypothetical protein T01_2785 [Trichinella spiralis]
MLHFKLHLKLGIFSAKILCTYSMYATAAMECT